MNHERRPDLSRYIAARVRELDGLSPARRASLTLIAARLRADGAPRDVVFGCTHNSRRSVFSQVWATIAAGHVGAAGRTFHSGGSEPRGVAAETAAALERAGIDIAGDGDGSYVASFGAQRLRLWSKRFDDATMPERFGLVVNCGSLDESCPHVPAASFRLSLLYADPRRADGGAEAAATYDATCAEIARDQLWLARALAAPAI
jgi:arsenate reductase